MLKNVQPLGSPDLGGGINSLPNFFALEPDQSPNCLDVEFGIDKSVAKRLGVTTLNTVAVISSASTGFSPDGGLSPPQVFWNMNEASGNRVDNFNSPGLTLTDVNTVANTNGLISNAAFFVSANSEALTAANTSLVLLAQSAFTFSCALRLSTTMGAFEQRTIACKRGIGAGLTTSLNAFWRFERASGNDSTANGNNLTNNNTILATTGRFGDAANLVRASDQYYTIADNASLSATGDFSLGLWVMFSSLPAGSIMGIAGKANGSTADREWVLAWRASTGNIEFNIEDIDSTGNCEVQSTGVVFTTGVWYYLFCTWTQTSGTATIQVNDGTIASTSDATVEVGDSGAEFSIGRRFFNESALNLDGRVDSFGFWNGVVVSSANRTRLYAAGTGQDYPFNQDYEWWLGVNSDSTVMFRVSSSGWIENRQVVGTSFGALATGAWYTLRAFRNLSSNFIGVDVNLSATTASYTLGVRPGSANFTVGAISGGVDYFMDGAIDQVGLWDYQLNPTLRSNLHNAGAGNEYNAGASNAGWGMYDFGAGSALRWVVISAGTGIVASSNRAMTFVTVATTRSLAYQSFIHSKSHLIATSESRDSVLIWPGSVGTFFTTLAVNSAQAAKYAQDFQGFTMLMNWSADPRGVAYADNNTFTTDPWTDTFSLPSAADDEITGSAILNKKLYIFTREKVFRVSHVGGNPDFEVQEVISSWGAIQKTIKKVLIPDLGEVIVCLCWDRRIRVFDGNEARIISDPVEQNNGLLNLSLAQIEDTYLNKSFAELDTVKQVYKLWLAISPSSDTTHCVNLNLRTLAWYWSSNTPYNAAVMAQSGNSEILLTVKRDGFCHWIDTTNADAGTTINEYYDSPFYYTTEMPKEMSKGHRADFYWAPLSSGTVYIQDKLGWVKNFVGINDTMVFADTANKGLMEKSINIPKVFNVYQFRLSSSGSTAVPWKLLRADVEGLKSGGLGRAQ